MDSYKTLQIFTSIASALSASFAIYSVFSSIKEKKINIQIDNIKHFFIDDYLVFKMTISNNSSLPISITSIDLIHGVDTYPFSLDSFCYDSIIVFEGNQLINKCLGRTFDFPIYIPAYGSVACCVAVNHQDIEVNQHAVVIRNLKINLCKSICKFRWFFMYFFI